MSEKLPRYDELPVAAGKPPQSSWGVWGDGDVLGCLNLLTPERVVEAARLIRRGAVIPLNLDAELPNPPIGGREPHVHDVRELNSGAGHDDSLHNWNTQSSSQWDGFRHIGSQYGYYNGVADQEHGIHHWARKGIAGRGVLADVARWREAQGRPLRVDATEYIQPEELTATLEAQGVEVREGDILLVRTGYVAWYRGLSPEQREAASRSLEYSGLAPGEATARLLWDLHVAAVAADNISFEAMPPKGLSYADCFELAMRDTHAAAESFVHFSLIPLLGLPIGELWDLEALAEDCAGDGVYEFFLTSAPLNLKNGVASPPNALAIK